MDKPKNSGRSKCAEYPNGKRRMQDGKERAPKSARRNGKTWLTECSEAALKKAEIQ